MEVVELLEALWEQLRPDWESEGRERYRAKLFEPLADTARGIYRSNQELERYAHQLTQD